jgi:hypothetical protein
VFLINPLRASMLRFLLLAIVLLSTSAAHGQVLYSAHKFQVYEEEFSFFNVKTMHPQGTSSHRVNYAGALQVRRHNISDTSPLKATGELVCQLSGIDYLRHDYEREVMEESYNAQYKAYRGGVLPPASGIPAPRVVEVRWEARCGDEYTLQVIWFLSKSKAVADLFKSYYVYTLRCHSLD